VFAEKPLGLTAAARARAAAACTARGVTSRSATTGASSPRLREVRRLFDDGTLGKLLHVEGNFCGPSAYRFAREHWRHDRDEVPAGGMTGRGVHVVDAMLYLAVRSNRSRRRATVSRRTSAWTTPPRCFPLPQRRDRLSRHGDRDGRDVAAAGLRLATAGSRWATSSTSPRGRCAWRSIDRETSREAAAAVIDVPPPSTERAELEHFARPPWSARRSRCRRRRVHNVAVLEAIVSSAREQSPRAHHWRDTAMMRSSVACRSCSRRVCAAPRSAPKAFRTGRSTSSCLAAGRAARSHHAHARAASRDTLGQPVVVENRGGAGGIVGTAYVAKQPPTATRGSSPPRRTPTSRQFNTENVTYDPVKDFTHVTLAAQNYGQALIVNAALPAKDVQELIALAKKQPGKLTYGSAGIGTASHIPAEMMKAATGTDILMVPYRGVAEAMTDLLAGRIDMFFVGTQIAVQHVKDGKVRALAVTGAKRWKGMPDVPTMQEAGVPGFNVVNWFGLWLPAGAPPELVQKIMRPLRRRCASRTCRRRSTSRGSRRSGRAPRTSRSSPRRNRRRRGRSRVASRRRNERAVQRQG
jgi:tripartite-type tricarboxylate transporter receptor subunit TctC/predicted dehydrogenase